MSEFNLDDKLNAGRAIMHRLYHWLFGLTKAEQKEQEMKIAYLEAEAARLAYGSDAVHEIIPDIVKLLLDCITAQGGRASIVGDTVYYVVGNGGDIHLTPATQQGSCPKQNSRGLNRFRDTVRNLPQNRLGD